MHPLPLRLLTPLALLIVLGGCNSKADTAAEVPLPRPVLAAKVDAAGTQQSAYTGVVAARTESDLGFRVSGKVIERKVDPGQHVSRGDTLLVLDIGDFELALRSAKNRVNAAQAQLRQRRDDENRYQRLANTGAVSRRSSKRRRNRMPARSKPAALTRCSRPTATASSPMCAWTAAKSSPKGRSSRAEGERQGFL